MLNSLNLILGNHPLDESAARKLFTRAVENAHARIVATEANVAAAATAKG